MESFSYKTHFFEMIEKSMAEPEPPFRLRTMSNSTSSSNAEELSCSSGSLSPVASTPTKIKDNSQLSYNILQLAQAMSENPETIDEADLNVSLDFLGPQSPRRPPQFFCGFCKRNGEVRANYMSHVCKNEDGTTSCPILRRHKCELCGQTGDYAHTRSYCPIAQLGRTLATQGLAFAGMNTAEFFSTATLKETRRNSSGYRRHNN